MKKLILSMLLLMWSIAAFAETHIVSKGETLHSIAEKYHVSLSELITANPGADRLFYVGLKLNIPTKASTAVQTPTNSDLQQNCMASELVVTPTFENTTDQTSNTPIEISNPDTPGFHEAIMLEYGFLSKPKYAKSSPWTYAITVGANYYFMHNHKGPFAGARIGYNSSNYIDGSQELKSSFLALPICAGYSFRSDNDNWGISPQAGFDFNFCVSSKSKNGGKTVKGKKKVGLDARIGVQLDLYGFNIGCSYIIPVNKDSKRYFGDDSYLAINIGFGF